MGSIFPDFIGAQDQESKVDGGIEWSQSRRGDRNDNGHRNLIHNTFFFFFFLLMLLSEKSLPVHMNGTLEISLFLLSTDVGR